VDPAGHRSLLREGDLPTLFLRSEGLVLVGLSVFLYAWIDESWLLFALLLLAPDFSIVGYAAGPRVGAISYNIAHTYLIPASLIVAGVAGGVPTVLAVGLIWFAHIGLDRLLGYGLKQPTGFRDTHLGRIGRDR
jgi:Domain of unknown function (DUF4260)